MKKSMKIKSIILFLVLTISLNVFSFALTDQIFVTIKDDVPIRPNMYANSGVERYLDAGNYITISGQDKNSHGNLWYKTVNGNWVYSENIKKANVTLPPVGNYITNRDDVPLRYGANSHFTIRERLPLNTIVKITSIYYADTGNLWGDLKYNGDHYKIWMGNLSRYTSSNATNLHIGDIVELNGRYYASSYNSNNPGRHSHGTFVIDRISTNPSSIYPYGIKPIGYKGNAITGWASKDVLSNSDESITIHETSVAEEQKENEPVYTPPKKSKPNPFVDAGNNIIDGVMGVAKGTVELVSDAWDSVTGVVDTTIDTGEYIVNTVKDRNIIEDNIELFNILTSQIEEDGVFTSEHLAKITNTYDPLIDTISQNIQELPASIRDELASGLEEALQSGDPVEVYSSLFQLTVKSAGMVYEGMNIFDKKLASKVMDKVDDIDDSTLIASNTIDNFDDTALYITESLDDFDDFDDLNDFDDFDDYYDYDDYGDYGETYIILNGISQKIDIPILLDNPEYISLVDEIDLSLFSAFERHYTKHVIDRAEFGNITRADYFTNALELATRPRYEKGLHTRILRNGREAIYDEITNELVIVHEGSYIGTYFVPIDGMDGFLSLE